MLVLFRNLILASCVMVPVLMTCSTPSVIMLVIVLAGLMILTYTIRCGAMIIMDVNNVIPVESS